MFHSVSWQAQRPKLKLNCEHYPRGSNRSLSTKTLLSKFEVGNIIN